MKLKKDLHLTLRIPKSLKEALEKQRAQVSRESGFPVSLSSFILTILENFLDKNSK